MHAILRSYWIEFMKKTRLFVINPKSTIMIKLSTFERSTIKPFKIYLMHCSVLYRAFVYSYINTSGHWKSCGNMAPAGRGSYSRFRLTFHCSIPNFVAKLPKLVSPKSRILLYMRFTIIRVFSWASGSSTVYIYRVIFIQNGVYLMLMSVVNLILDDELAKKE